MAINISGRSAKDLRIKGIGAPTYNKFDKYINAYNSAGIFEGGLISDSGSGQIDISAAKGVIRTVNTELGEIVAFDIAATTNVSLTDNSMNYIYVDYNAGTPIWAVTLVYEDINLNTKIIAGRVYRMGTTLYISNVGQDIQNATLRDLYRLQTLRRIEHASGATLSFVAATRQPTVSAGVYFSNYSKLTTAAFNASGADRFVSWYRDGGTGWSFTSAVQNIDNNNYDNGTGTLAALNNNQYGVHWVFQLGDGTIHVQYGQNTYTLADARNATVPSSQPPVVAGLGILIGRFIILKGATVIYESASAFTTTFTGTSTTSHNDLAGLQGGTTGEYYHLSAVDYNNRNVPVVEISGTTQQAVIRTRYVCTNAATTTVTLPSVAAVGDFVEVEGRSGLWIIAQNSGQLVRFLSVVSSTGVVGTIQSTNPYECVHLRCVVANTTWEVLNAVGNLEVL